jgi:protease I
MGDVAGFRYPARRFVSCKSVTKENHMQNKLKDRRVAILATNGFEQSELLDPLKALKDAGAKTEVISPESGRIRGWDHDKWGESVNVDRTLDNADPMSYDALVLPGGVISPDRLRTDKTAVDLVRRFFEAGKPVAAICHGPWMIVEADAARGRRMTSYHSIKTDLKNAGAEWVDEEVVVDQGLVTSRSPKDLPVFCDKMVEEIAEGVHAGQHA